MELENTQQSAKDPKSGTKKAYWKPSVQVYGLLAEVTKAVTNPVAHRLDGGHTVGWTTART
jgi:hypothetical protein